MAISKTLSRQSRKWRFLARGVEPPPEGYKSARGFFVAPQSIAFGYKRDPSSNFVSLELLFSFYIATPAL
jgi:hypothetical protein